MIVPGHLFAERAAQALQRAALELIPHAVGIRDRAAVLADDEPLHHDCSPVLIDVDFGHHRRISVLAFVAHAGDAPAADGAGLPDARPG